MSPRIEHLAEGVTLILGDCRKYLPILAEVVPWTLGKVDAVVTDPPYGQDYQSGHATDSLWIAGRNITNDHSTRARDEMLAFIDVPAIVISHANEMWKGVTGTTWSLFFIDGLAYMADWMGAIRPELTREFLAALGEVHRSDLDRDGYERAKKMVDVRRRALIESFEADEPTRQ